MIRGVRIENCFLRYLCVSLGIGGVLLFAGCWQSGQASGFKAIPLVQGTRSLGLPLAGVAVDANRRDVFAIVGGRAAQEGEGNFVILWKGEDGASYCAMLSREGKGLDSISQIFPDGKTRKLFDIAHEKGNTNQPHEGIAASNASGLVSSIIEALPADYGFQRRE